MAARLMAAILIATLCGGAARADVPDLAADWFTQGEEFGFNQLLMHLKPDKTFTMDVRVIDNCKVTKQWVEAGRWALINGSLRRYTSVVRGKPTHYQDDFHIDTASGNRLETTDTGTHRHWTLDRVAPDFKFPLPKDCLVS